VPPRCAQRSNSGPIRPPQRLAPYSYALGAEVSIPDRRSSPNGPRRRLGRLILLHDPDGSEAWDGTMRLGRYHPATWTPPRPSTRCCPRWRGAGWSTRSTPGRARHSSRRHGHGHHLCRYGDISGPPRAHQLEMRASWTATSLELGTHVQAFCEVSSNAPGCHRPGDRSEFPFTAPDMVALDDGAADERARHRR